MKVGIDIDNTTAVLPVVEDCVSLFGDKYKSYSSSCPQTWGYGEFPEELTSAIYSKFSDEEYMTSLKLFPGVLKLIADWSVWHSITFITSRPTEIREKTRKWITGIFPFADMIACTTTKENYVIGCNFDVMIDDDGRYFKSINEYNSTGYREPIKAILISNDNTPYNHKFRSDASIVVEKLTDVIL